MRNLDLIRDLGRKNLDITMEEILNDIRRSLRIKTQVQKRSVRRDGAG